MIDSFKNANKEQYNVLPPELLHIGDNFFANVNFQSLAFLDFQEETKHFMKASKTWYVDQNDSSNHDIMSHSINYNEAIISSFPTKTFTDFKHNPELEMEKAMIRYNDKDIDEDTGGTLYRSLFNHPCNLYVDIRYFSSLSFNQKENFCLRKMDLFSRFHIDY